MVFAYLWSLNNDNVKLVYYWFFKIENINVHLNSVYNGEHWQYTINYTFKSTYYGGVCM